MKWSHIKPALLIAEMTCMYGVRSMRKLLQLSVVLVFHFPNYLFADGLEMIIVDRS